MSRLLGYAIACALALGPALAVRAQSADMQDMPHAHHDTAAAPAHAGHAAAQPAAHDHEAMDHAGHDDSSVPPNDHVPPAPPQHLMPAMSAAQMISLMQMDDAASLGMLSFDRLERARSTAGDNATRWDVQGWWGNGIDRVWLKTEGERGDGTQGRVDALWSHAFAAFWDWQLGARHDIGQGPKRDWAAFGVEGLAPYWFETQATFYAGGQGRTALRVEASYDMRFTQRLILQPKVELNLYGKDDPQRGIASGLSDVEAGLRLRYEFSRKVAPYLGVDWMRRFGDRSTAPGIPAWHAHETTWVAGVRLWF